MKIGGFIKRWRERAHGKPAAVEAAPVPCEPMPVIQGGNEMGKTVTVPPVQPTPKRIRPGAARYGIRDYVNGIAIVAGTRYWMSEKGWRRTSK